MRSPRRTPKAALSLLAACDLPERYNEIGDGVLFDARSAQSIVGGAKFCGHPFPGIAPLVFWCWLAFCAGDLIGERWMNNIAGVSGDKPGPVLVIRKGAADFLNHPPVGRNEVVQITAEGALPDAGLFVQGVLGKPVLLQKNTQLCGEMGHGLCV